MSVLVMVLLSFILIACSALCLFAGVLFFGKPLTKGCGKEECCRKKNCENKPENLHSQRPDE
ncbi:hypothetical protein [Chlamydiifrater volucris]|uniref:hypothetical protein n=1 Tax=Chlamydiifrater volucris TaxID=2681470 RepID=UPI001BCE49CD|nr:hypothetical protein [Chlamydiifrater volucris]